jgi:phage shock protein A
MGRNAGFQHTEETKKKMAANLTGKKRGPYETKDTVEELEEKIAALQAQLDKKQMAHAAEVATKAVNEAVSNAKSLAKLGQYQELLKLYTKIVGKGANE